MGWLTPQRIETEELLDEHDAPRADMERSLRDLRLINRWLGGIGIYRRLLRRVLPPGRVVILDIGTGTSDLLESLRDRPDLLAVGLDFKIDHLLYRSTESRVRKVVGDAHQLPFRDNVADAVTSAHFFHHFSPDENVGILSESMRVARNAVVVNDTRRHYVPLLLVTLLGAFRLVGRITRFDAPASVRQGYTIEEARAIADRVSARTRDVVHAWPFRFGIILRK